MSNNEKIEKASFAPDEMKEEIEEATETSKKNVFCWAMYDLANTIYSMVIVSLLINRYILVIGQLEAGLSYGDTSLIFGIVQGTMQAIIAICVPILGALSDTAGKRKPYVISLTGIILLFASLLGFSHSLSLVLIFYLIANTAYQFSLTFYDAMLPFIAKKDDREKVAGFGVAWGYLGTIISLLIVLPLMMTMGDMNSFYHIEITLEESATVGLIDSNIGSTASLYYLFEVVDPIRELKYGYAGNWFTFVLPMLLFFGFALPFFYVREKQKKTKVPPIGKLLKGTFGQLRETFKDIRSHRAMFIFIIGYFFVSDIANVIVAYMMPLVTDGLIIGQDGNPSDIFGTLFIIIATISAVAFTYFVGAFGRKFGPKKCFYLVGFLWGTSLTIGVILIFALPYINIGLNGPFIMSLLVGIIAGPALGGTWTAQRVMVVRIAPKDKFGEYFGFSKLSGKISSAIGPLVMGAVLSTYDIIGKHAYGWALISVGIILALGILIISFVEVEPSKLK
jgi:UMF1 family MFS transporter